MWVEPRGRGVVDGVVRAAFVATLFFVASSVLLSLSGAALMSGARVLITISCTVFMITSFFGGFNCDSTSCGSSPNVNAAVLKGYLACVDGCPHSLTPYLPLLSILCYTVCTTGKRRRRLVEHINHDWIHLDELPHEPPGFYFDPRLGKPAAGGGITERAALFHYVPGQYMHYLHFVSSQACTCELTPARQAAALSNVAVGVYSTKRRLSTLDERRIANAWGAGLKGRRAMLQASGREYAGVKGDMARLRELMEAFPAAGWLLFLPVEHYVVPANLAVRIKRLEDKVSGGLPQGSTHMMISGVYDQPDATDERRRGGKNTCDRFSSGEEGAFIVGRDLAETILSFEESVAGGVFPTRHRGPADREVVAWARTLSRHTVLEDAGLVWRLPTAGSGDEVGCPATFPMDPDLADLKSEFTVSEGQAVMAVTQFLLRTSPEKVCRAKMELAG